ncbi:MAG: hypothetical protein ACO4AU_16505, partial [bacterium]
AFTQPVICDGDFCENQSTNLGQSFGDTPTLFVTHVGCGSSYYCSTEKTEPRPYGNNVMTDIIPYGSSADLYFQAKIEKTEMTSAQEILSGSDSGFCNASLSTVKNVSIGGFSYEVAALEECSFELNGSLFYLTGYSLIEQGHLVQLWQFDNQSIQTSSIDTDVLNGLVISNASDSSIGDFGALLARLQLNPISPDNGSFTVEHPDCGTEYNCDPQEDDQNLMIRFGDQNGTHEDQFVQTQIINSDSPLSLDDMVSEGFKNDEGSPVCSSSSKVESFEILIAGAFRDVALFEGCAMPGNDNGVPSTYSGTGILFTLDNYTAAQLFFNTLIDLSSVKSFVDDS